MNRSQLNASEHIILAYAVCVSIAALMFYGGFIPPICPPLPELYDVAAPISFIACHYEYAKIGNASGLYWYPVAMNHTSITITSCGVSEQIEIGCAYQWLTSARHYWSGDTITITDGHGCTVNMTVPQVTVSEANSIAEGWGTILLYPVMFAKAPPNGEEHLP
jgi:hypothetical protein